MIAFIINQTAVFVNRRRKYFNGKEVKNKMCKECGRQICVSACPEFNHYLTGIGYAKGVCDLCGEAIYPGEGYYRRKKTLVCKSCEECLTMDELRLLLDTREALLECGFEKYD